MCFVHLTISTSNLHAEDGIQNMEPAFNLGKQIQSWPKYSPFLRHFAPHVSIFYSAGRIPIFILLKINVKTLARASITSGNDGNITGLLASVGAPGTWLDKYHISSHIMRSQLPNSIILRRAASSQPTARPLLVKHSISSLNGFFSVPSSALHHSPRPSTFYILTKRQNDHRRSH